MNSKNSQKDLKPFFSLIIIFITFFAIAFLQMEERRLGYQVFYLTKEVKKTEQEKRVKEIELAKLNKPSRLMQYAKDRLTLQKPEMDQIIHIAGPVKTYSLKKRIEIEN
ncbi:MAG: cell division protein FtsL [Bdellovibrionaceae bacterium]|nr:cell division protein FtsL [Pseudobdellovibrionaceae bacterium]